MFMRVASGAGAVLLAWLAVWLIRAGRREWRDTGDEPLSHRLRSSQMDDDESLAGRDRGAIVLGLSFAGLGLAFAVLALTGNDLGQNTPLRFMWGLLVLLGFGGFVVCLVLYELILYFSRPRFLVPPQHRNAPGAIASRRRKREHLPLKSD